MIVNGAYRGCKATLESVDMKNYCVCVKISQVCIYIIGVVTMVTLFSSFLGTIKRKINWSSCIWRCIQTVHRRPLKATELYIASLISFTWLSFDLFYWILYHVNTSSMKHWIYVQSNSYYLNLRFRFVLELFSHGCFLCRVP